MVTRFTCSFSLRSHPHNYPWKVGPQTFHQQFMFRNFFRILGVSLGKFGGPSSQVMWAKSWNFPIESTSTHCGALWIQLLGFADEDGTVNKRWLRTRVYNNQWMARWWFQIFFIFTHYKLEMIQFDEHIFQMGWLNHQLDGHCATNCSLLRFGTACVLPTRLGHVQANETQAMQRGHKGILNLHFINLDRSLEDLHSHVRFWLNP